VQAPWEVLEAPWEVLVTTGGSPLGSLGYWESPESDD